MAKGILQTPLSAVIRAIIIVHRPLKALPARTEITGLLIEIIGTETTATILEATDKYDCQNQRSKAGRAWGWLSCRVVCLFERLSVAAESSGMTERTCMS